MCVVNLSHIHKKKFLTKEHQTNFQLGKFKKEHAKGCSTTRIKMPKIYFYFKLLACSMFLRIELFSCRRKEMTCTKISEPLDKVKRQQ